MPHSIFNIIALLIIIFTSSHGDHIVFLHTCGSYSHRTAQWPLVKALASKGHNVTFISPFHPNEVLPTPSITEIQPQRLANFMATLLENQNFDVTHRAYGLPLFMVIDYICYTACRELHHSEEFKTWVESDPSVDLVISDLMPDCSYGMVKKFKAKNILYMPIPMLTKHFESFGINPETSSVPDYDVSKATPFTFFNRVVGALLPLWYRLLENIFFHKYLKLFENEFGMTMANFTELDDMRDMTSLILINGDYLTDYPRSLPPFVVKLQGIHVKKHEEHRPLDNEIESFINTDKFNGTRIKGFIYISFGTLVKLRNIPSGMQSIFFNTMRNFQSLRFIWNLDGESLEMYPGNLHFVQCIDQQGLLAHPRIKAFITHAGRPSFQESLYNGVPTITFPVVADQDFNSNRMANLGTSVELDFVGLTEEKLTNAILKILEDVRYKARTVQLANLAKDVPVDPLEAAVGWVEFVLRHRNAELLQMKPVSRHLTWYQKRNLDVWSFLIICFGQFLYLSFCVVCKIRIKVQVECLKRTSEKLKTS